MGHVAQVVPVSVKHVITEAVIKPPSNTSLVWAPPAGSVAIKVVSLVTTTDTVFPLQVIVEGEGEPPDRVRVTGGTGVAPLSMVHTMGWVTLPDSACTGVGAQMMTQMTRAKSKRNRVVCLISVANPHAES